jgi:hypothetical protein
MEDFTKYFEYGIRLKPQSTSDFICMTDKAPEELRKLIHSIHDELGSPLPNYWIYHVIRDAFEALKHDELENVTIETDIYPINLVNWSSDTFAINIINESLIDNGYEIQDFISLIDQGQYYCMRRIYNRVNDFIKKMCEVKNES